MRVLLAGIYAGVGQGLHRRQLREDESNIMTDYFAHSVTRRVLLGFSKSDRNNFREMRKLAATFGPMEKLATEGQENRENYTGGSGYYLSGPYRRSGWTIRRKASSTAYLAAARPFWILPTG